MLRVLLSAAVYCLSFQAFSDNGSPSTPQINAQERIKEIYGSVELRHQNDVYYRNAEEEQIPSLQSRVQLGALLYNGTADIYASTGVTKYAQTQRVQPERSELNLDLYPLHSKLFTLRQFHKWRLPFKKSPDDFQKPETAWEEAQNRDGTVYALGLEASYIPTLSVGSATLSWPLSSEVQTVLYSQKQYIELQDEEKIEDYIPRIASKHSLGVAFSPGDAKSLNFSLIATSYSHFLPQYQSTNHGIDSTYAAERSSSYKLRLSIELNKQVSLINDFYHYFDGFFRNPSEAPKKRFSNMTRISCLL